MEPKQKLEKVEYERLAECLCNTKETKAQRQAESSEKKDSNSKVIMPCHFGARVKTATPH